MTHLNLNTARPALDALVNLDMYWADLGRISISVDPEHAQTIQERARIAQAVVEGRMGELLGQFTDEQQSAVSTYVAVRIDELHNETRALNIMRARAVRLNRERAAQTLLMNEARNARRAKHLATLN